MGKFRPKTFGITVVAIVSVIFILVISTSDDGGIGAIIPPPTLEIVTDEKGTFIVNPDTKEKEIAILGGDITNVACWMKQSVTIFSLTDPTPIATIQSDFFQSRPVLAIPLSVIIDKDTGRSLANSIYVTAPEIKCVSGEITTLGGGFQPQEDIDPEDPNLFKNYPNVDTPLTIQESFFKITVFAQVPSGIWIEVFNTNYTIDRFDITSPTAIRLDSFTIRQEWIDPYLPEGDYNSRYRFVYDGAVLMNWKQTNTCDIDCAEIPFVIPVVTEKTFDTNGQLVSLFNEFQIERDIEVGKPTGTGVQTITCDALTQKIDPDSGLCIPIPPNEQPCPQGEVKSGNICIEIVNGVPNGNPSDVTVPFGDLLLKIQTCLASGEPTCLASAELLPLWIFGIGIVVVIGAVAQRRQPEIYGVPRGGGF